ncbi:hypothetical protein QL989_03670 [Pseudoalteromonas sp. APC 3224]|uniref:hypothetical protein n=1 Tax=Pseudoalteromonas sp. APC 3224 TaxID=3035203 RepID=UPI0025B4C0D3|nr:hypothetical protein [Pseudoalteromonas sp. APC 3224]MDN3484440.1 hypothetical protein [Pseudoalteromonas sp. APC 3224]
MTNLSDKSVGTMTMVNLTGNELEVWVNSNRLSHLIPEMKQGAITYQEKDSSPVTKPEDGSLVGFEPVTKTFLRALEIRPGYFHNGTNVIKVDRGGVPKTYTFDISGQDNQVLSNSTTITITRSSFIVAAPNGTIWYQSPEEGTNQKKNDTNKG